MIKNFKFNNKILKILASTSCVLLLSGCNREIIDLEYGLESGVIVGDNTSILFNVESWKDYQGEQYKIVTKDGLVMLTSSFDTDLFYGKNNKSLAKEYAKNAVSLNGEVNYIGDFSDNESNFNKNIIDTDYSFNKAVVFNGNRATVINITNWKTYEGEQIQVKTEDGITMLLSSYNTKLFYDINCKIKAEQVAAMYVGSDGVVSIYGKDTDSSLYNYNILDINYGFNKAIILKDKIATIVNVEFWNDYDGEQIQLRIKDGPLLLTSTYDTFLVNDLASEHDIKEIAEMLSDKVVDYTNADYNMFALHNYDFVDFKYGFAHTVISNKNMASGFDIEKWKTYNGEQIQLTLPSGDVILTSSMFADLFNDGNDKMNTSTLINNYSTNEVTNTIKNPKQTKLINYEFLDLVYKYKYALKVESGNVTIIPINKWKDYDNENNSDDKKDNNRTNNCEQIQLKLPDNTKILTTAYDTILVNNVSDIKKIAELFRGENGVITDLTSIFGEPNPSVFNLDFLDFSWKFNYAISNNGQNSQIFEISYWFDYDDGEQVKLKFKEDGGILASYVNTTLISTDSEEKVEALARAFAGEVKTDNKVYKYK